MQVSAQMFREHGTRPVRQARHHDRIAELQPVHELAMKFVTVALLLPAANLERTRQRNVRRAQTLGDPAAKECLVCDKVQQRRLAQREGRQHGTAGLGARAPFVQLNER